MRRLPPISRWLLTLVGALSLTLAFAAGAAAQTPAPAGPAPGTPVTLSRQNMAVIGGLAPGASVNFNVDYQPQLESSGKLAPWLLRLYYSAPGAAAGSIGFTWTDNTGVAGAQGSTFGNTGKSSQPQFGGNITDVPVGADPTIIQQAVLSGGASGSFSITVSNGSTVQCNYTLQLLPLLHNQLETGLNPNPTPMPVGPTGAPLAAGAAPTPPAPGAPAAAGAAPPPPPAAAPAPPNPAATTPPPPPNPTVTITDGPGFTPNTVTIKAGQTVTWVNQGQNVHTATADDGSWDSGGVGPGVSFSRTFPNPGTFPYHSEIDVTYNSDGTKNILFRGTVVVQ